MGKIPLQQRSNTVKLWATIAEEHRQALHLNNYHLILPSQKKTITWFSYTFHRTQDSIRRSPRIGGQQGREARLAERRGRWGRPSAEARQGGAACQDQAGGRGRRGRHGKWGRPSGEGRWEREARTARKVASSSILFPRRWAQSSSRDNQRHCWTGQWVVRGRRT
jgi:hypothetical protein